MLNEELVKKAMEAALKSQKSCRILSLDNIQGNYKKVESTTFEFEDGTSGTCLSKKFNSLEKIDKELNRADLVHYVYQICEFDKYGIDLKATGEKYYTLRSCVRKK